MQKYKIFFSILLALFITYSNTLQINLHSCQTALSTISAAQNDWIVMDAYARQEITINNPTDGSFSDIPVLVRLNSANIPNKNGVSFYSDNTLLSSEIAGRNTDGISTYWVKIPYINANSDISITAYYSGSDISNSTAAADVWSDNYELVQHFSESAVAAGDSTGNGIPVQTGTLTYKNNDLGSAATFTGSQKIVYDNKVIGANADVFSVSAVVNFTSVAGKGGYYGIVCRDRNGTQTGDTFMLTLSNNLANSSVYAHGKNRVNVQKEIAPGITYLLTMTYDGSDLKFYINGELAGISPAENAALLNDFSSPFTIGAYSDTALTSGLKGDLYDVFFKTSLISEHEETFRYANYFGNTVTVGELETCDTSPNSPLTTGSHYLYNSIIEDTYCYSNGDDGRTSNFGSDTSVMQKRTNTSDAPDFQSSANRRAFVKLDLTKIAEVALNRVEAITFDFYQIGDGGSTNSITSRIIDVNPDSWEELTVNWTNMPSTYNLPVAASQTITKKNNSYQSFDITNYVKDKIAKGQTIISFSLDNEPSNEWGLIWKSREAAENKPRLTVKIKEPAAPVMSTTLNGSSATLTAQIEQNPSEETDVTFYKTENIPLTPDNTVVYYGETADILPYKLTINNADNSEQFSAKDKTTIGKNKTPYQIYEITLNDEEKQQNQIELKWAGNTASHQREVTGYFYNHTLSQWTKLNSGSGKNDFSLTFQIPVNDALNAAGKIQILIWRGMTEDIKNRPSYSPPADQYDFNIMWSTDTQKYTENLSGIPHVQKQFDWIADNFKAMNSRLFIHTGDMVENYNNEAQWEAMSNMYQNTIEKAKIPYAFTVGNHDVNRYDPSLNIFQKYFPIHRLSQNNPYFVESLDDMTYYYLMEEHGAKLMFVGLGIPVTQDAVDWINNKLRQHSDYTAILLPHIYIKADGTIDNSGKYGAEVMVPQVRKIIEENDNVKLVLCGHWNGASTNLEYFGERPVWTIMHNYQDEKEGGYGYFRFLKFDIENNLIYTHTYSASDNGTAMFTDKHPKIDGMYQKHRDEYAISFDFASNTERTLTTKSLTMTMPATREQIGTTQTITGSGSVSVTWENLDDGDCCSWYAVLSGALNDVTDIQTFTVPKITIDNISCNNDNVITVNYTANGIADGTPLSIIAFAVDELDNIDTVWNSQNVSYNDIYAHDSTHSSVSFAMPHITDNGIAGIDTTKMLLIKIGGEYTRTISKMFTLPLKPEILKVSVDENNDVKIQLSKDIQNNEALIVASYTESGELLCLKTEMFAKSNTQTTNEYVININLPEYAQLIKVMLWNDLKNMQPLCPATKLQKIYNEWTE